MKASAIYSNAYAQHNALPPPTPQQIEAALQYIDPGIERNEWAKIGMAVKSELAEDGLELFDTWSQGGENYSTRDTLDTWRSIKDSGGIGIGTLFKMAIDSGYKPEHKALPPAEQARLAEQQAERKAKAKQEQSARKKSQQAAAETARKQWNAAQPADPNHLYLKAKGITGIGLKQDGNTLLTPMQDAAGTIHNIERITAPGQPKKGLKGGRRKGLFSRIKGSDAIVVSEGYATSESIYTATGWTALCAFGKANLEAVAMIAREKMPDARIIIAGDVGSEKYAQQAAAAINGEVAIPTLDKDGGDFNDLHQAEGRDAVRYVLEGAVVVDDWPEITPLNTALLPVEPFNYKLLPDGLSPWVRDITERTQCPPDFVAVTVMISLAALIGRKVAIYPMQYNDWLVIPNLWGALIGRPSAMKSPAMAEGLRPLKRLSIEAKKEYQQAVDDHKLDTMEGELREDLLKAELKSALRSNNKVVELAPAQNAKDKLAKAREAITKAREDAPESPVEKRYIVNDVTVEKLGELLNQNPNGLLLERDELTGWLKGLDREDRSTDRSFYLQAFNGDGAYTYDRIGRGTVHIESTTVSLIGGLQPSRLRSYVWHAINQGAGDDGLLQRFQLAVYPDDPGSWTNVDRWPDKDSKQAAFEIFKQLDEMDTQPTDDEGRIEGVRFDAAGQNLFNEWRESLEQRIREPGIHPAIESHLIKYRSLMPSLALIINEVEQGHCEAVTTASATKAAAWCQYLESHAMRIYGGAIDPAAQGAELILDRRNKLPDGFTQRIVQRKNWTGLSEKDRVKAALDELVDCGYLRENQNQTGTTGGRPSLAYSWNPNIEAKA